MGMARCWYLRFSGWQCRPRSPSLSERGIDVSTRASVTPRGNPPPRERVVRATLHPRYIAPTGWPHSRQCHKSRQFSSRSLVETRRAERVFISILHWIFIRVLLSAKCMPTCIVLVTNMYYLWLNTIKMKMRQRNIFFYQLYDKLRDINYVIIAIIATRLLWDKRDQISSFFNPLPSIPCLQTINSHFFLYVKTFLVT